MDLPKSGFLPAVFSALLAPFIRLVDKRSRPKYQGCLTLGGLEKTVQVKWDRFAIPHVTAATEADLFLAQGYLHAQERLWQMEMSRRFFSGRMAEIFGDFTLPSKDLTSYFRGRTCADFDYFLRILGIDAAAKATASHLAEPDRLRLQKYCDGINRYIEGCGRKLPWEFRVLRCQPDPWRPQDTLTIGKGLSLFLSPALFIRLNFMALAAHLKNEPQKLRDLYPASENVPTITRAAWDQASGLWQFTRGILTSSGWAPSGQGSNSWVVAPSRSKTGNAILCNDPHLRMTLPSLWYLMHLKGSDYEAWGASIPGLPFIQIGSNRWIAWGVTAAVCDDVEIYREKLHRLEPSLYWAGEGWEKFKTRPEPIAIRGRRAVEQTIRLTRHGPVISDFHEAQATEEVLALRWTAHETSEEFASVYQVNQARDWKEFKNALRRHGAPSLNFVYADGQGNIGYALAGKIPRRTQTPSLFPVEGWREENEWQGYLSFEELPSLYNPPEGFVATANNRIVDSTYPYYLSHFFEPPYRFRRIHQLLSSREKFSAGDLATIQLDAVSLHAKELMATLKDDLRHAGDHDPALKAAVDLLLDWDGNCLTSSVAATLFHVFHHRLLANLLVPALGEELFTAYVEILNQCIAPTDAILRDPNSPWFRERSRERLVAQSLREARQELTEALGENMEAWHWGRIHRLEMNHPFGRIDLLKPLLGIGPLATPGDGMTVNMGFYRHSNPYDQTVGASLRCVIEPGNRKSAGFVLASGQSGHPLSTHYADQVSLWLRGESIPLHAEPQGESPYDGGLHLNPA